MGFYAGLDVSLKRTQICVVGAGGEVVWRGWSDTHPEMIAEKLAPFAGCVDRVGLETGSLSPWLFHALKALGLPVVCMDARRAADAIKARSVKTDKTDALALAEMLRAGWFKAVHVKSEDSHRHRALLGARDQLVKNKRMILGQVRGMLKPFGITFGCRQGTKQFGERARQATAHDDILSKCVGALFDALTALDAQIAVLDREVRSIARASKACWHLMSVPGVGPITALAFAATIEDPARFKRNRDVGAYLGLTPRRYQSGDRDISGGISHQGDDMTRHYLYEAANCLLTTVKADSPLKAWGRGLAQRVGAKKARTAVARKMAVLLMGIWKEEAHFSA